MTLHYSDKPAGQIALSGTRGQRAVTEGDKMGWMQCTAMALLTDYAVVNTGDS